MNKYIRASDFFVSSTEVHISEDMRSKREAAVMKGYHHSLEEISKRTSLSIDEVLELEPIPIIHPDNLRRMQDWSRLNSQVVGGEYR